MNSHPIPSVHNRSRPKDGIPSLPTTTQRPTPQNWRSRAKAALNASHRRPLEAPAAPAAATHLRNRRAQSPGLEGVENSRLSPAILVAHGDEDLLGAICVELRDHGFTVILAQSGEDALTKIRRLQPALVILDLALPGQPGLELCKQFKADPLTADIQVILLSGDDSPMDRIIGFELGADDYIHMPCLLRELALRVQAVMRRTLGWQDRRVASIGPIVINHAQCVVLVGGQRVHLTATEFRLLALLAGRAGVVQSRDTLLCEIWGDETAIDSRSIDTYFRRLRAKLGEAASYLKTVRGHGYRFAL